jgi:hypothetical protein
MSAVMTGRATNATVARRVRFSGGRQPGRTLEQGERVTVMDVEPHVVRVDLGDGWPTTIGRDAVVLDDVREGE